MGYPMRPMIHDQLWRKSTNQSITTTTNIAWRSMRTCSNQMQTGLKRESRNAVRGDTGNRRLYCQRLQIRWMFRHTRGSIMCEVCIQPSLVHDIYLSRSRSFCARSFRAWHLQWICFAMRSAFPGCVSQLSQIVLVQYENVFL